MEEKHIKQALENIKLSPEQKSRITAACVKAADEKAQKKTRGWIKPAVITACACLGVTAAGAGTLALINGGGAEVSVLPEESQSGEDLNGAEFTTTSVQVPLENSIQLIEISYDQYMEWSGSVDQNIPDLPDGVEFVPATEVELMDYFGINIFAEFPSDLVEYYMAGEPRGIYKDENGNAEWASCLYHYESREGGRAVIVCFSKGVIIGMGQEQVWSAPSLLSYIDGVPAVVIHTQEQDYYEIQFMLENTGVCIDSYGGVSADEMVDIARSIIQNAHSQIDHIRWSGVFVSQYSSVNKRESADRNDFVYMSEEGLLQHYGVRVIPDLPEGMDWQFDYETGVYADSSGKVYNDANLITASDPTGSKRAKLWISTETDDHGDDTEYLSSYAATICGHTVMLYRDLDDESLLSAQFYNGSTQFELTTEGLADDELIGIVRSLLSDETQQPSVTEKPYLTLNDLLTIKKQKGEDISLRDFEKYSYEDGGSDVMEYYVVGGYSLTIGNDGSITLFPPSGADGGIDLIRNDLSTLEDYIKGYTPKLLETGKEQLTAYRILRLKAAKGEDLTWSDFEPYQSEDIGSGLYVLQYDVEGEYTLLIGGGDMRERPAYISLSYNADNVYIDLLQNDSVTVRDFISVRTPDLLPPKDYGNAEIDPAVQAQKAHDIMVRCAAEYLSTATMVEMLYELYPYSDRITVYADSDSFVADEAITDGRAVEAGMLVRIIEGDGRTELVVPAVNDFLISAVNSCLVGESTVAELKAAVTDVIPSAEVSVFDDSDSGKLVEDSDFIKQSFTVGVWCGGHHYIIPVSELPLNEEEG